MPGSSEQSQWILRGDASSVYSCVMDNKASAPDSSSSQVQSVDRALTVLEFLANRGSAGVTEIAKSLEVHKSTAFRLLVALENHELVEQIEERGKYRLGLGLVRLAGATAAQLDLTREGRPLCVRLAEELGETVNIAVLDTGAATNIAQEHGGNLIEIRNWVGKRTPLHATSSGKVLLAAATDTAREELLRAELERFTEYTITSVETLREQLASIVGAGWASCHEELEVGLNSIAAPIRGANGDVVGAISVSGPSYRVPPERFEELAERLIAGAGEVSVRMGFFEDAPA
jgi:DNA-binding IclR family transcriptional regulator